LAAVADRAAPTARAAVQQATPAPVEAPVESLRRALMRPVDAQSADELKARRQHLEEGVKGIADPADLARALVLQEWRDMDPEEGILRVDRTARAKLADRLETGLRELLRGGDTDDRLAAAIFIGEMGSAVRDPGSRNSFASRLTADLARLARDAKAGPRACAAAARALGKVLPEVKLAAGVFGDLFKADDVALRRAAAEGVLSIVSAQRQRMAVSNTSGVVVSPQEMIKTVSGVLPVAGRGAGDKDCDVAGHCLRAVRLAAEMVRMPVAEAIAPGVGAPPPPLVRFQALIQALARETPRVAKALAREDVGVVQAAEQALEAEAGAYQHLRRVPPRGQSPALDQLRGELRQVVGAVARKLSHTEVRVRLGALYVLETLAADADAAAPELVKALRDADPFVRWGAVRALGKMPPPKDAPAAAELGRLLEKDDNRDVRVTAAAALECYGEAARPAVDAVSRAARGGDPEARFLAVAVLAATRSADEPAIAALVDALSANEPQTRAAAAEALGRLPVRRAAAVKALRKALDDSQESVRQAASAALLRIKSRERRNVQDGAKAP
jgi:HEAT repeat protein